jgi:hypothetical protein
VAPRLLAVAVLALALFGAGSGHDHPRTASAAGLWQPAPGTTWYWQLSCPGSQAPPCVNMTKNVQVYDIDGFDNTAATVSSLHARGITVVCYLDAGTWENWRPDAGKFPNSVKGEPNGWPGERWLDIRQASILEPIMTQRAQMCKSKGFDAIEWDNVDGYSNDTGFNKEDNPNSYITPADQIQYNTWLAGAAHALGLAVALKNDVDQADQLQAQFDFAVDEQCFQYSECGKEVSAFIAHGKAVFEVEYHLSPAQFCAAANRLRLSAARADLNLDGKLWIPCWRL